jgi:hypothetical protein
VQEMEAGNYCPPRYCLTSLATLIDSAAICNKRAPVNPARERD